MRARVTAHKTERSIITRNSRLPGQRIAQVRRQLALFLAALTLHLPAAWGQSPSGVISTAIGGNNGDGHAAANAIVDPVGMEARGQYVYIADGANHRVRRVDTVSGIIIT